MPTFSDPFWETVFKISTISALVLGGLGVASAFVSAWVGYEVTDATQREASKSIAEANARSAEAKLETERLRAQAAWRRITQEQHDHIVRALEPHNLNILVKYVAADPEASQFAKELIRTLKDAGASVDDVLQIKAPPPLGIIVEDTGDARSELLLSVLKSAGLAVGLGEPPLNNPGNQALLQIASKPPLF